MHRSLLVAAYRRRVSVQNLVFRTKQASSAAYYSVDRRRRSFSSSSADDNNVSFEGVSEDTSKLIYKHAHEPQTSVSLQALMRTGRGEYLHKTYRDDELTKDSQVATERVLIQVSVVSVEKKERGGECEEHRLAISSD
jgi:hypothetical protein